MNHANVFRMLALCGLLTACSHDNEGYSGARIHLSHGGMHLGDGQITLYASNAPDAVITANGDLQISQQAVAVDPVARELLKTYYQNAMARRQWKAWQVDWQTATPSKSDKMSKPKPSK
jgi:hypothetical protein